MSCGGGDVIQRNMFTNSSPSTVCVPVTFDTSYGCADSGTVPPLSFAMGTTAMSTCSTTPSCTIPATSCATPAVSSPCRTAMLDQSNALYPAATTSRKGIPWVVVAMVTIGLLIAAGVIGLLVYWFSRRRPTTTTSIQPTQAVGAVNCPAINSNNTGTNQAPVTFTNANNNNTNNNSQRLSITQRSQTVQSNNNTANNINQARQSNTTNSSVIGSANNNINTTNNNSCQPQPSSQFAQPNSIANNNNAITSAQYQQPTQNQFQQQPQQQSSQNQAQQQQAAQNQYQQQQQLRPQQTQQSQLQQQQPYTYQQTQTQPQLLNQNQPTFQQQQPQQQQQINGIIPIQTPLNYSQTEGQQQQQQIQPQNQRATQLLQNQSARANQGVPLNADQRSQATNAAFRTAFVSSGIAHNALSPSCEVSGDYPLTSRDVRNMTYRPTQEEIAMEVMARSVTSDNGAVTCDDYQPIRTTRRRRTGPVDIRDYYEPLPAPTRQDYINAARGTGIDESMFYHDTYGIGLDSVISECFLNETASATSGAACGC